MKQIQYIGTYGLIKKNGKVLVVQREMNDTHPGMWEVPGGGLEFGENPRLSVIREVKEETGIDVEVDHLITVVNQVSEDNSKQVLRLVYYCNIIYPEQDVILSHEHMAYKWIEPEDKELIDTSRFLQEIFTYLEMLDQKTIVMK